MEIELLDSESLCRACLAPAARVAGSPEGGARDLRLQLIADMFLYCTSLPVEEGEQREAMRWPRWVCGACYELLAAACRFKRQCLRSHRSLHAHFHPNTDTEVKPERTGLQETDGADPHVYGDIMCMDGTADSPDPPLLDNITIKKKCEGFKEYMLEGRKRKPENVSNGAIERSEVSCDVCGRSFVVAARLEAHRLRHHAHPHPHHQVTTQHQVTTHHQAMGCGFASLTCDACGKVCKSERTLRRHRATHAPRAPVVCHVCGRAFKSPVILQGHLETHKENRERSHACAHCDKRFYSAGLLSTHVSRLHRGRRFICQVCSFPFANKDSLSKHLGRHAGLKPHECELCLKRYSTHSFLAEHRRTHTGERPYACTHCTKAFVSSKRLRDHVRTHTGEKPHKCGRCEQAFVQRGEKPHKCGRCEQAFVQRGTLTRHMRVHDKRSVRSSSPPPVDLTLPVSI